MEQRRRLFAGARVRDLRKRLALPQAAMASRLGVSVSYLSQIENEERPLTPPVLIALTREFPQLWGEVGGEDVEAGRGKRLGDGEPDAPIGPGDDCCAAGHGAISVRRM